MTYQANQAWKLQTISSEPCRSSVRKYFIFKDEQIKKISRANFSSNETTKCFK